MAGLEQRLLALIRKHGKRGILVDTNVFLLYLFGQYHPSAIGRKRLERYSLEDADLIIQFLGRFRRILATQHVLAETSNLARQIITGSQQRELSLRLHPLFCLDTPVSLHCREIRGPSINVEVFVRLGLTDAGLTSLVNADVLLLTDDLDLYLAANSSGDAINFTHMREAAGTV
jgi:predicted nucleic acid-binding protein